MNPHTRITSTDELLGVQRAGSGYITNVDLPTSSTTIHHPDCSSLTIHRFEMKTVHGGGKTGGWYHLLRPEGLDPRTRWCKLCARGLM